MTNPLNDFSKMKPFIEEFKKLRKLAADADFAISDWAKRCLYVCETEAKFISFLQGEKTFNFSLPEASAMVRRARLAGIVTDPAQWFDWGMFERLDTALGSLSKPEATKAIDYAIKEEIKPLTAVKKLALGPYKTVKQAPKPVLTPQKTQLSQAHKDASALAKFIRARFEGDGKPIPREVRELLKFYAP